MPSQPIQAANRGLERALRRSMRQPRQGWALLALGAILSLLPAAQSQPIYNMDAIMASPNYSQGRFVNPIPTTQPTLGKGMVEVARRYLKRPRGIGQPPKPIPVLGMGSITWPAQPSEAIRGYWMGHSSFVLELEGLRILTDPVLSRRVSPFSFAGPARMHEAPLVPDQLPPCDVVLISHDHYDHLDRPTMRALFGKARLFIVPLGVGSHLIRWGCPPNKVVELDWGQEYAVGPLRIVCCPARHFSGRGLRDRDHSLWASYAIIGQGCRIYFAGDSGDQPEVYDEIGEDYGPFDLALMPIGAYDVAWHDIHTDPAEALTGALALHARHMLPCHWATFDLALHPWGEPIAKLIQEVEGRPMPLLLPKVGEEFTLKSRPWVRWWE